MNENSFSQNVFHSSSDHLWKEEENWVSETTSQKYWFYHRVLEYQRIGLKLIEEVFRVSISFMSTKPKWISKCLNDYERKKSKEIFRSLEEDFSKMLAQLTREQLKELKFWCPPQTQIFSDHNSASKVLFSLLKQKWDYCNKLFRKGYNCWRNLLYWAIHNSLISLPKILIMVL